MNRHRLIPATLFLGVSSLALAVMLIAFLGSKQTSQEDLIAQGNLPAGAVFCLGSHRFVYSSGCDAMSWSPHGKYLACRGLEVTGTVHLFVDVWERKTGKYALPAELRRREISGFAWGPEEGQFVTSEFNAPTFEKPQNDRDRGRICLWTIGQDQPIRVIDARQGYSSLNWSPDGKYIVARTMDDEVRLFAPDGKRVGQWKFAGAEAVWHSSPVFEFTRDSKRLLQASEQGVTLHELPTGAVLSRAEFKEKKLFAIRTLTSDKFGVAGESRTRLFQILPMELKAVGQTEGLALDLAASPDGKWLAITGFHNKSFAVKVHDLATLPEEPTHVFPTPIGGVAFDPQSAELALPKRRISFVDSATWQPMPSEDEHAANIVAGAISDSRLWTRDTEGRIIEWNLETGRRVRSCLQTPSSPFGSFLCGNKIVQINETDVTITKADDQAVACTMPVPNTTWGAGAIFSRSLNRVYSSDKHGFLRSWDVTDGSLVFNQPLTRQAADDSILRHRLTMSADGQFIASIGGDPLAVTVIDPTTGMEHWHARLELDAFMCPCAFSANSTLIAYPHLHKDEQDKLLYRILVCDRRTGKSAATIPCTLASLDRLALLPDGKILAAAGKDDSGRIVIQLWSVDSAKLVREFRGHLERCTFLEFSANGSRLVSASQDTTAYVWDTSTLKH